MKQTNNLFSHVINIFFFEQIHLMLYKLKVTRQKKLLYTFRVSGNSLLVADVQKILL